VNFRERLIRTVRFEPVDRLPWRIAYGTMPGVLDEWHEQGLPASVKTDNDLRERFGFRTDPVPLPIRGWIDPPFETRVIKETDEERIAIDRMGRRTRLLKKFASIALPMEFPVSDMDSWQDFKRRMKWSPDRIGEGLEEAVAENVRRGHLNRIGGKGFYWFPRDLMGDENLCIAYYEQPELVHDICNTMCLLREKILIAVLERVRLDEYHLDEDMAYRNGSMIGRKIFDEFIRPYYERIRRIVERCEVPIFSVDTDGRVDELTEWFRTCGINLIGPLEVQAGNDVVEFRRRFGRTLAFEGGLDKRVLPQGREAIDVMLERTIPAMKDSGGGWLMSLDHRIISGTKFADFQYFMERLDEMGRFE